MIFNAVVTQFLVRCKFYITNITMIKFFSIPHPPWWLDILKQVNNNKLNVGHNINDHSIRLCNEYK